MIVAASGTSGAGKAPRPHLLGSEVMGSMSPATASAAATGTPRDDPEPQRGGGGRVAVSFTPTLAPMPRGILATCSAKAVAGVTADSVRAAYEGLRRRAVRSTCCPRASGPPRRPSTVPTPFACGSRTTPPWADHRGQAPSTNLTKGTAGGAVQSMNIALGLAETTGLSTIGVAP
ncbi:hypothetical protein LT493_07060 [Streptomyces tricolor]|nr:hypothetical protein [Streptomyces tricolor]